MDTDDFVHTFICAAYTIRPAAITSLQQFPLDRRGIYRIDFESGYSGVLRLNRDEQATEWYEATARVLFLLESLDFPAPRVLPNRHNTCVSSLTGWVGLMTSYIPGEILTPAPPKLATLAQVVAELHSMSFPPTANVAGLRQARWSLEGFTPTKVSLLRQVQFIPGELSAVFDGFAGAIERLERIATQLPVYLVHGDSWFMNAVQSAGNTILIDWDNSGLGFPVFDLAYLLLTSHYNVKRPLEVILDRDKIRSIVEHYVDRRQVLAVEQEVLLDAMRFCLAEGFVRGLGNQRLPADSLMVKKLLVRYAATEPITTMASHILAA